MRGGKLICSGTAYEIISEVPQEAKEILTVSWFAVTGITYVDEQGKSQTGIEAIRKLKKSRKGVGGRRCGLFF